MIFEPSRIRVYYALDFWTPFRREVFEDVLPHLECLQAQILYLVLYDKIWHNPRPLGQKALGTKYQPQVVWRDRMEASTGPVVIILFRLRASFDCRKRDLCRCSAARDGSNSWM